MNVNDEATTTSRRVRAILALGSPAEQERAIAQLLDDYTPCFRRQARRLCATNAVAPATHLDDVLQLVLEAAWGVLTALVSNPASVEGMVSLESRVWVVARPVVRSEMDKIKSPASEMVSAQRRAREIARTRLEMLTSGREQPTVQEIITATNDRVTQLRTDAARQGLLVTAEDLTVGQSAANIEEDWVTQRGTPAHDATATDMTQRVLRAASREGAPVYEAALIYLTEALGPTDPNKPDVTRQIAAELGVSPRRARALMNTVIALGRQELRAGGYGPDVEVA